MAIRSQETLDRLEHEAQQARATVSSQLAQVRHRLEPEVLKGQAEGMKDQLIEQARDKSSRFIEERKQRVKQTVLDAAMNNPAPTLALGAIVAWALGRRLSRIPAPILLVGAGGLAGLMRWNDGSSRTDGERTYSPDYGYARPEEHGTYVAGHGYTRSDEQRTYAADYGHARPEEQSRSGWEQSGGGRSSMGEAAKEAAEQAREMAAEAGSRISDTTARAGAAVSDMASQAATRISEGAARAASAVSDVAGRTVGGASRGAGGASDLGRRARSQFSELFERHPLVLGGLGLALGAAIAYSFRPTETEARWVGDTSDRFKRRAREMAEEQFHRARSVTERAYEAARDEAREQGISPEGGREAAAEIGRKARAVADRATEAARETWSADTTA
jgi:hypothetical protein